MELKIWCKTFLNAYRCLEKITQAIDKIVLTTGLNSNYDTKSSANKIIELTERKITLINLKLLIEKTLNQLDTKDAKLLLLKYVDKVKSEDIAKVFNISNRTFLENVTVL
jgi:DNA-directed RNA polymerase specialized sigma24 family protein